MSGGAHVGSIDAVRDFRAALVIFAHEARESLLSFDIESRRTMEWLLETQPKFWQQEVRRCEEVLTQAKIDLERCRNSRLPGGEAPSCMEERKAVDRARQRKQYAEDKLETTRKCGYMAQREAIDYNGRANQLTGMFDMQFPAAMALLDRVLSSLEAYTAVSHEVSGVLSESTADAAAAAVSRPTDERSADPAAGEQPADSTAADAAGAALAGGRGMRNGDLTSGPARLYKAWQKFNLQWEEAKRQWHDPVSQQFEEKYLVEWDPQIMLTLERMRALATLLHSAEQQCAE